MFENYRKNDIDKCLRIANFKPFDIMVTGVTGAGKSTTLNSLFDKIIAKVGFGVEPETMELDNYELNDSIRFWDTPGLGDGISQDQLHSKKLVDLLFKTYSSSNNNYGWIDVVLIIIEGSTRDMGTTYRLLNEIIVPNFQKERILVAINQADVAMKGRNWDYKNNKPNNKLLDFLEDKSNSIKKRVKEATGINIIKPIYYSAEKNYNISKLFDLMVNNLPKEKRKLVM